jgi:fluoroacetyl-CoA thioesterase
MPPVFATAFLVGLIEWACMETIRDYLEADEQSLGTAIAVTHTAATPVGFSVKVTTRVESVEGRRVRFSVRAEDEAELIGEGTHERFVIARQRFLDGVAKKRARLGKA